MKYASHGDLGTYLKSNYKDLKWAEKLDILLNFSEGLSLIHENGCIH
ncbi:12075_t:CDS:1, partial [Entrophospora sp. SA101]